MKENKDRIKC